MITFTTDEIKMEINKTSKAIDSLFDYYQKGYIDIRELDSVCNDTINTLYDNIYCNTYLTLTTSEIIDYVTDIKISTYSKLANLYKERAKERKIN